MEDNNDELQRFETKFFADTDFVDRWNLKEHSLFMKLNKKDKPYIKINEENFDGAIEVNSLQAIANYIRTESWAFEPKYKNYIVKQIQGYINFPFS